MLTLKLLFAWAASFVSGLTCFAVSKSNLFKETSDRGYFLAMSMLLVGLSFGCLFGVFWVNVRKEL